MADQWTRDQRGRLTVTVSSLLRFSNRLDLSCRGVISVSDDSTFLEIEEGVVCSTKCNWKIVESLNCLN